MKVSNLVFSSEIYSSSHFLRCRHIVLIWYVLYGYRLNGFFFFTRSFFFTNVWFCVLKNQNYEYLIKIPIFSHSLLYSAYYKLGLYNAYYNLGLYNAYLIEHIFLRNKLKVKILYNLVLWWVCNGPAIKRRTFFSASLRQSVLRERNFSHFLYRGNLSVLKKALPSF